MNTPKLPPLPEKVQIDRHIPTGIIIRGYNEAQMNAHYLKGYNDAIAAIQAQDNSNGVVVSKGVPDGLTQALQTIADWGAHSLELAVEQGSNGVRDFYRQIAMDALASSPPAPQAKPKPLSDEQKDAVLADVVSMLSKQHDWLTRTSAINLVAGLYGRARFVLANVIKE